MAKWYLGEGEQSDVVISTRIRLARNLKQYPFPARLDTKSRLAVNEVIRKAVPAAAGLRYIEMKTLTQAQIVAFAEKHVISPEFASSADGRALLLSADEELSVMLNEEDHIRLQVMLPGLALEQAYDTADKLDTAINEQVEYAFDERLGYLTQCPTNLGTGMRASVMLHLPALAATNRIGALGSTVSKLGLTIRGAYGEGTAPMGDLYQVSNQVTLGISEKAAMENLKTIVLQIAAQERAARTEMLKTTETQDLVYRAYGILKSARLLDTREFMELISRVRFGAVGGLLPLDAKVPNALMIAMQPANLNARAGKNLSARERDELRAKLVREAL